MSNSAADSSTSPAPARMASSRSPTVTASSTTSAMSSLATGCDDTGAIVPGLAADLVHIDAARRVTRTWIAGEPSARDGRHEADAQSA